MKTISVIIPFFNEQENLPRIHAELLAVRREALGAYALEILFMDNHSDDDSFAVAGVLAARAAAEPGVSARVIRLSRNFGYQANILAGMLAANGDAVVQLDADGEDDPRIIVEMARKWADGFDVVYGVRRRRHENFLISLQRKLFYRLLNALSSVPMPLDAGDFRLLDRRVIEALRQFREANPYLRGLIAYAGFRQIGIAYDRRARWRGESKFSWWDYLTLAWDGITSFSRKPLTLATWLGFVLSALSFVGFGFYLVLYLVGGVPVAGFTTLVLVQLFLAGVQLMCIGLLGTYLGRIFDEVKARPRSLIESDSTVAVPTKERHSA